MSNVIDNRMDDEFGNPEIGNEFLEREDLKYLYLYDRFENESRKKDSSSESLCDLFKKDQVSMSTRIDEMIKETEGMDEEEMEIYFAENSHKIRYCD